MQPDRRAFLQQACGVCSCLGAMALLSRPSQAYGDSDREQKLQQQLEQNKTFASGWTTDLIDIMDSELNKREVVKILEACGRRCAKRNSAPLTRSYHGNLEGLLQKMKELWLDSYEHDPKRDAVRIVGREMDSCPCPIHPADGTLSYCACSNGHMQQLFGSVTGRTVKVELEESLIRGGKRCTWSIWFT